MRRNRFDLQKCIPYLSTFGKQVLEVLMHSSHNNNDLEDTASNGGCTFHRKSSVQTYESLNTPSINVQLSPPIQIYTSSVINCDNDPSAVPTISKRNKTYNEERDGTGHDNFLNPAIVGSNIVDQKTNSYLQTPAFEHLNIIGDTVGQKETIVNVNWDNMFDSELCNFNEIATDDHISKVRGENCLPSNINIINKDKQDEKHKYISGECKKVKKNNTSKTILLNSKSKNDVLKPSFRKQKYTTAIMNWLSDINSYNTHNEDTNIENISKTNIMDQITVGKSQEATANTDINSTKFKITLDKTAKCTKKVVQARLANKDGIMKFSKPAQDKKLRKIEGEENKSAKDKKEIASKKFNPPIKSQLPVKDITYEIFTIDENNVNEILELTSNINVIKTVTGILIYSNGCQLDCNSTEDSQAAVGILFCISDKFFYIKDTGNRNIRNAITHLIKNNAIISYEARNFLVYLASHLHVDVNMANMYDVKIGESLLDPDNPPQSFSNVQKLLSLTAPYTIAAECTLQKSAWYMTQLDVCWSNLKTQLEENQLWQVFVEIEMKLLPIISDMECRGIAIDESKLKSMEQVLLNRMKQVEQGCYKAAKKEFQINSPAQVRNILYDELQLDSKHNVKITETLSTGVKSTSEIMLRSMMSVHPLPKLILEYRHLHKAHATYLAGIAQHVRCGVVRPTWVQTAAATGRIASNNPNLQAIPKVPFSLVMFPDANHKEPAPAPVRLRAVYAAHAGCALLAADFRHVECRVLAHAAQDAQLAAALSRPGDLFRELAAHWLKVGAGAVGARDRERAKRLVYAAAYGAGPRALAAHLALSYEEALQLTVSFNRTFPALKWFGRHVVSQCLAGGGRLATPSGRVRRFEHIGSEVASLRAQAERQAVNFVVQGTAADLCKMAMILTEKELRSNSPRIEAHLVLQIHDELVWEVRDEHVPAAAGIIKRVMEGCGHKCGMPVSLPVAITVGKNWADMEPYEVVDTQ